MLSFVIKVVVSLRQVSDWCRLLWPYRETLDVKKVESILRRMGLVSEWKSVCALGGERPRDAGRGDADV
ncbi:MAG: hypothetical protein K5846_02830 [Bacteroidales bacterium]|nr:hypothetical protein [Bacteroidales bacterium]